MTGCTIVSRWLLNSNSLNISAGFINMPQGFINIPPDFIYW
ncbi:hypothetical protein BACFIN_07097 [Bacteroides finegoldii DSM 17565]|nr:hypothetical protein BACFIN_07097 [Bacteroides finegoldii DSM 17565]